MTKAIIVRLTQREADEVWAALDSHAQSLSDNSMNPATDDPQARAATNRAIDKFQKAMTP